MLHPGFPQSPPATPKNPPPYYSVTLLCRFRVFVEIGVTSTISGRLEVNLSLSGKRGGKSHLGMILLSAVSGIWRFCMVIRLLLPISLETMHDPKEPVLLMALKILRHAKLCLSVIMFLICVLAPRKDVQGTVYLWAEGASLTVESLNNTACF